MECPLCCKCVFPGNEAALVVECNSVACGTKTYHRMCVERESMRGGSARSSRCLSHLRRGSVSVNMKGYACFARCGGIVMTAKAAIVKAAPPAAPAPALAPPRPASAKPTTRTPAQSRAPPVVLFAARPLQPAEELDEDAFVKVQRSRPKPAAAAPRRAAPRGGARTPSRRRAYQPGWTADEDVIPAFLLRPPPAGLQAASPPCSAAAPAACEVSASDEGYMPAGTRSGVLEGVDALLEGLLANDWVPPVTTAATPVYSPGHAPYNPPRRVTLAPKEAGKALDRLDLALRTHDCDFNHILLLVESIMTHAC